MSALFVLAAGASGRMGLPKAKLLGPRGTWLEGLVAAAREAELEAWAVVQPGTEVPSGCRALENPDWPSGMWSSARRALAASKTVGHAACLLLPVDCPLVDAEVLRKVVAATLAHGAAVASHLGQRGHPLGLDALHVGAALGHATATTLEAATAAFVMEAVEVGPTALTNLNDAEAYARQFGHPPRLG